MNHETQIENNGENGVSKPHPPPPSIGRDRKPKPLRESDWSFHKIPDGELASAWQHEFIRLVISQGTPYLKLSSRDRRLLNPQLNPEYKSFSNGILEEHHLSDFHKNLITLSALEVMGENTPWGLHVLNINWGRSNKAIQQEFADWMAHCEIGRKKRVQFYTPKSAGRGLDYKARLTDLAIYRAYKSGMTRLAAESLFEPLRSWAGIVRSSNNKFSAGEWPKAVARMRARLATRAWLEESNVETLAYWARALSKFTLVGQQNERIVESCRKLMLCHGYKNRNEKAEDEVLRRFQAEQDRINSKIKRRIRDGAALLARTISSHP